MLDFNSDANNSIDSEKAVALLLENAYNIKIDVVAGQHLKYDLIVVEGNENIPEGLTIDVKENFDPKYNSIILECVNSGWNSNIDDDKSGSGYLTDNGVTVKSYGWAFSENMVDTDYIFFLDKQWKTKEKGTRLGYLISREEILRNNKENDIINGNQIVKWNYVSRDKYGNKWRSAFIVSNLNNFEKIKFSF